VRPKFKIEPPRAALPSKKSLHSDIKKYLDMIPHEPEPNLGRVYEIKQEIKKGKYPTQEMIDEAAHHLAMRLARGEKTFLD
jgi:hypothetical protein